MKANLYGEGFVQAPHFLASASFSVPSPTTPLLAHSLLATEELLEVPQTYLTFHPLLPQLPIAGLLTVFRIPPKCYLPREVSM